MSPERMKTLARIYASGSVVTVPNGDRHDVHVGGVVVARCLPLDLACDLAIDLTDALTVRMVAVLEHANKWPDVPCAEVR